MTPRVLDTEEFKDSTPRGDINEEDEKAEGGSYGGSFSKQKKDDGSLAGSRNNQGTSQSGSLLGEEEGASNAGASNA